MLNWFRKKPIVPPPFPVPTVLSENHQQALHYGRPSLYTPDMPLLERYERQLLFVADEWMRDRRQNFVLDNEGAIRHGRAFTFKQFSYRTFNGAGVYAPDHINVALPSTDGFPISGEVVDISPYSFLRLDKLKKNTVELVRQRVILAMPYRDGPIVFENTTEERGRGQLRRLAGAATDFAIDHVTGKFPHGHPLAGKKCWLGTEKIAYIKAWMYVGVKEYWKRFSNQPFLFSDIPTFKPKKNKWWLTRYYRYQNPKG